MGMIFLFLWSMWRKLGPPLLRHVYRIWKRRRSDNEVWIGWQQRESSLTWHLSMHVLLFKHKLASKRQNCVSTKLYKRGFSLLALLVQGLMIRQLAAEVCKHFHSFPIKHCKNCIRDQIFFGDNQPQKILNHRINTIKRMVAAFYESRSPGTWLGGDAPGATAAPITAKFGEDLLMDIIISWYILISWWVTNSCCWSLSGWWFQTVLFSIIYDNIWY